MTASLITGSPDHQDVLAARFGQGPVSIYFNMQGAAAECAAGFDPGPAPQQERNCQRIDSAKGIDIFAVPGAVYGKSSVVGAEGVAAESLSLYHYSIHVYQCGTCCGVNNICWRCRSPDPPVIQNPGIGSLHLDRCIFDAVLQGKGFA